jgi:ArsR family transcriptional regulator
MARSKSVIEVIDTDGCCPSVLAAPLDNGGAAELARGFTALADPVRLRLLSMLAAPLRRDLCVRLHRADR